VAHLVLRELAFPKGKIMTEKVMNSKFPPLAAVAHSNINLATGLVVVLVDGAVESDVARQVLIQQIMKGDMGLGIQFPQCKTIRSWHSGGQRHKDRVEAANNCYPDPPNGITRRVRCIDVDHRFNWLSDAGLMALRKTLKGNEEKSTQGDWNVILQNSAALENSSTMHVLFKLRHEATSAGNHVMLIIGGLSKISDSANKLFSMCDEIITIEACEADQDSHLALKIAVPSLNNSHQFGKGAVMASLIRGQDKYKINITPFIASELKQRLAWWFSGSGKSLDEIGKYLDVNKSTVSRWLQKMPPVKQVNMTEEEIEQALESIECLPAEKKKTAINPTFSLGREAHSKRKVR
jgi:hypothetical protein